VFVKNNMDTIMQPGTTSGIHVLVSSTTQLRHFYSRYDGSVAQPDGIDPISEKQEATRCNSGDEILPYMLRLIFGKKIMDRPYVYFFLFFFIF
jgi:hypothetical protein